MTVTIDVHAHFLPPIYRTALTEAGLETLDGGMPVPNWTPKGALAIMDEVGIAGAILSVSSPHVSFVGPERAVSLCRAINDYAADIKRRHPKRFGAYAILPLPDMDASLAELERALDQLELDGVALPTHSEGHYLGDPLLAATVFIHPTSPCCFEAFGLALPAPMIEFPFETTRTAVSLLYSGALTRHSRINFILPHGGGTLPFLAPRIAAIGSIPALGARAVAPPEAMRALARFHYDTALAVAPQQIAALRTLAPISRILYGTDYPFANEERLRMAEQAFQALPFTAQEQHQIRQGNATRLFGPFAARRRDADHD